MYGPHVSLTSFFFLMLKQAVSLQPTFPLSPPLCSTSPFSLLTSCYNTLLGIQLSRSASWLVESILHREETICLQQQQTETVPSTPKENLVMGLLSFLKIEPLPKDPPLSNPLQQPNSLRNRSRNHGPSYPHLGTQLDPSLISFRVHEIGSTQEPMLFVSKIIPCYSFYSRNLWI